MTTVGLARVTAILGDEVGAEELGEQAQQLARTHTDLSAEAFAANVLAQLASARGDAERVAQCRADTVRLLLALKRPTFGTASWRPAGLLDRSDPQTGTGEWLSVLGHAWPTSTAPSRPKPAGNKPSPCCPRSVTRAQKNSAPWSVSADHATP
ncbi:MAG TPA: hypothetical protein VHZ97_28855 [Pseudonocardiaceae bacterium]|nr:hypothetical protein [Pseudonocardiaceae bacterium]